MISKNAILTAVMCISLTISPIAGAVAFTGIAEGAVDGDLIIATDDSTPSIDDDLNAGEEYDFEFEILYELPQGESGVINLYLNDAGGRQIQKEVTGTGELETKTISVTETVPREQEGEGFSISAVLLDSNDDTVEFDDEQYTVTAPGDPPEIQDTSPPVENTVVVEKGETRSFSVSASDPDNDDLTYTWYLKKLSGSYEQVASGTSSSYSHTFDDPLEDGDAAYELKIEVADKHHLVSKNWLIDVDPENQDRSPSISRVSPSSQNISIDSGNTKQFEIEVSDPDIDYDRIIWYIDGSQADTRTNFPGKSSFRDVFEYTFETDASHTIRAKIIDSNGNSASVKWGSVQPDLTVTNMELDPASPTADEPTDFQVTVKNVGDKPANPVEVRTFVDGDLAAAPPTKNLEPGQTAQTVWTGDYKFKEGSHTVSAVVDPDDKIPESNEDNNKNLLEVNIGANDGYSTTLTEFDYSIAASAHGNQGVGRTENYNISTADESSDTAEVRVGSRAGPVAAESSSQGIALIGTKWEAPHSGTTQIRLTSSTTGSATVKTTDRPIYLPAITRGYGARSIVSQSIIVYDSTDDEVVAESEKRIADVRTPSWAEFAVGSLIEIASTVSLGLGDVAAKKVAAKGGGVVAQGAANFIVGEIENTIVGEAAAVIVDTDYKKEIDTGSVEGVLFEAEEGHTYAIYRRVKAETGTIGIVDRAAGAEADVTSNLRKIEISTNAQTGGPPNLQISQTPPRYVSNPSEAVVEVRASLEKSSDTAPEIGYRLVSPGGTTTDWRYRSARAGSTTQWELILGNLIENIQTGEYIVEFRARDPRSGIESEVVSVPVTVVSMPQIDFTVQKETTKNATLGMSFDSVAPVERVELQTKQAGEWTTWRTVVQNASIVYDIPGETKIRGRATDVAGNKGDWDTVTVTIPVPPEATISAPDQIEAGSAITLDASDSSDPDGDNGQLKYTWAVTDKPGDASIALPNDATGDVTLQTVGTYEFEVTVTDPDGATDTAQATVTVEEAAEPAVFDVAITETNSPVVPGETLEVTADIENTGTQETTQEIELEDFSGEVADSESVSLGTGKTQTVTLTWTTEQTDAGSDSVAVTSEDSSSSTSVTIEEEQQQSVEDYTNENDVVDTDNFIVAIDDWLVGEIETDLFIEIIDSWLTGQPVA